MSKPKIGKSTYFVPFLFNYKLGLFKEHITPNYIITRKALKKHSFEFNCPKLVNTFPKSKYSVQNVLHYLQKLLKHGNLYLFIHVYKYIIIIVLAKQVLNLEYRKPSLYVNMPPRFSKITQA